MREPNAPLTPENHRDDREAGAVVYPVHSRRSGGLSLGINLFPDAKRCNFDCPYCEVFPFRTELRYSPEALERGLRSAAADAAQRGIPVRDLCFSGNGEPTLSPAFPAALELAAALRDELCPSASLVAITNGSRLGEPGTADFLARAAAPRASGGWGLDAWLKADAGTESWYRRIDRCSLPFAALAAGLESFLRRAPATVQTMVCALDGAPPPREEEEAWLALALRLARAGGVRRFHIYGKARPAPTDPASSRLPLEALERRAAALRAALAAAGLPPVPVESFD